jgi:hypothetical protein
VAEGRIEVLRHQTIVAKLLGIVAMKFQLDRSKPRIFPNTSSIDQIKVFLLGLVRDGSKRHLTFDHRDSSVSQTYLVAGIDGGISPDSCSGQNRIKGHIGEEPDGGVEVARGIENQRIGTNGGVLAARGIVE